jgi:TPR repeat protein
MAKPEEIKNWLKKNHYAYVEIPNESLDKIHNLLISDKFEEPNKEIEYRYFGIYCTKIKDEEKAEKYLKLAIELGNIIAAGDLGRYYEYKGYVQNMIRCYTFASEHGNPDAMFRLGTYYYGIQDYDNMMRYLKMAIELGHPGAMNNLGCYYSDIHDHDNMMKYYTMAIELSDHVAMNNLGSYYRKIKDYDNIYAENDDRTSMLFLAEHYRSIGNYDGVIKYYLMIFRKDPDQIVIDKFTPLLNKNELDFDHYIQLINNLDYNLYSKVVGNNKGLLLLYRTYREKIDLLNLPLKYAPYNEGFKEALEDFHANIVLQNTK